MGVEFELKFRATPEIVQKIRQDISGKETSYDMETTYYDTRSGALSQRKFTLRRRMENGQSVCTLKTPAKGIGRMEFEVNSPDIEKALPELCKLSGITELPVLLASGIAPLCGAKFQRIAKTLTFEGSILELALDEGVLTGGGKTLPLCEIEVELKKGAEEAAVKYAKALAKTYGLQTEHASKFARSRALAKGETHGTF